MRRLCTTRSTKVNYLSEHSDILCGPVWSADGRQLRRELRMSGVSVRHADRTVVRGGRIRHNVSTERSKTYCRLFGQQEETEERVQRTDNDAAHYPRSLKPSAALPPDGQGHREGHRDRHADTRRTPGERDRPGQPAPCLPAHYAAPPPGVGGPRNARAKAWSGHAGRAGPGSPEGGPHQPF